MLGTSPHLLSLPSSSLLFFKLDSLDFNLFSNLYKILYLVSCSSTSERIAENAANLEAFDDISNAIGDTIVSSWLSDALYKEYANN